MANGPCGISLLDSGHGQAATTIKIGNTGKDLSIVVPEDVQYTQTNGNYKINQNGSETFRITGSTGNVGIGTEASGARLEVEGATALTNQAQTVLIRDSVADNATGRGGNIGFGAYVQGTMRTLAGIGALKKNDGTGFDGHLALYTRRNAIGPLDERMRITSAGDVGIGSTTPDAKLSVVGVGTFKEDVYIDKKLYVGGIEIGGPGGPGIGTDITTRHLKVTGIATVTGNTDLNGNLDVAGTSVFNDDVTLTTASGNNIVFDKSENALKFGNDVEARFGSFQQFRIKQNATTGNSEITHNRPQTLVLHSDKIDLKPYSNTSNVYLRTRYNSSIDLYYANSVKFATSGIGVTVTGQLDTTNIKATGITTTGTLNIGITGHTMVGITTILDEDNMASNSATALATQQSIKAYVDSSSPSGSTLAVSADSGSNESINLASEVLDIEGTSNEI